MHDISSAVRTHLLADSSVSSLVNAISLDWHDNSKRPYITITPDVSAKDYLIMSINDLNIDIWTTGPSQVEAHSIQKAVRKSLKNAKFTTSDSFFRLHIKAFGFLDEEGKGGIKNVRFNLTYSVRSWNNFLTT